MNKTASNRKRGARQRTSYSIRVHAHLLRDLHKAARANGRSTNAEIALRLEQSLVHNIGQ